MEVKEYRKRPRYIEDKIQEACVMWFGYAFPKLTPLLHHSPNGGYRNAREGAKFKKMGTRAGFPDLLLLLPSHDRKHHALGVELKTPTGRLSDNQKAWAKVAMSAGVKYVVVRSFDEFKKEILEYLNVKEK